MRLKVIVFGLCFCFFQSLLAQENSLPLIKENNQLILNPKQNIAQFNLLDQKEGIFTALRPNNQVSNLVYIRQQGNENFGLVVAKSERSDISLVQNGDGNKAALFLKSETIDYKLVQQGNNNRFLHLNNKNSELIEANVMQLGNQLNIIVSGNNGISEKMKINMTGDSRSLIIRNFN